MFLLRSFRFAVFLAALGAYLLDSSEPENASFLLFLDMEEENADSMYSSEPSGFKYDLRGLRPGQSYKVTVAPWTIGRLTQSGTDASENTSFTTPG